MRNRNLNITEYAIIFIMAIMFAVGSVASKVEERRNKSIGDLMKKG